MSKLLESNFSKFGKRLLLLFCTMILLMSCRLGQVRKEIRTLADLHSLGKTLLVSNEGRNEASISTEDFASEVDFYFEDGRDPWGNLIVFVPANVSEDSTFLLISTGSDGRLDHGGIQFYFKKNREIYLPLEKMKSESGRDIVIRGGEIVTGSAHK